MRVCRTNLLDDDIWQLCLQGPTLDAVHVKSIRVAILAAISVKARGFIIDLQDVKRLDPWGLAGLTSLSKEFAPRTPLVLAGLQGKMQEMALLLHLHDIFDIYEDSRAAMFDINPSVGSDRGCNNVANN
ncbi:MAG TPA: STAS domain-containing protein [Polyangium sp.]|nr:STAS domain-containing protein [Polyangium sp.]